MPAHAITSEEQNARKHLRDFPWSQLSQGLMSDWPTEAMISTRVKLVSSMGALLKRAEAAGRDLTEDEAAAHEYADRLVTSWGRTINARQGGNEHGAIQPYLDTELRREAEGETARSRSDGNLWRDRATGKVIKTLGPQDRLAKEPAGYQLGDLLRAMIFGAKSEPEFVALSEATIGTGGALVPTRLAVELIDNLRQAAVAFRLGCRTVVMDTPTLSVAKITSDPKPAWREELDPVSVTSAAFEKVTLTAKSCGWIVRASRELVQDAINFSQALTSLFVRVGATELDRAIFAGTGSASPSAEPLGLLSTVGLQEVDAGSAVLTNHDHILDLVGKVLAAHAPFPDAWAAAPQIEIDLAKLKQGTTLAPMPEPPLLGRITNRETTTALSDQTVGSPYGDNSLIVGNFSEVLVGIREQINSRPLIELYAATGEIGFVCHLRADVQVARPKAMGRLINVQTK